MKNFQLKGRRQSSTGNGFEKREKEKKKRRELKKNLWHQQTAPDHSRLKMQKLFKCKKNATNFFQFRI
jgi:hypothetical protein